VITCAYTRADRNATGCVSVSVEHALTVLCVEDDQPILAVVAEALSLRGFRVLATDNGYEAMRLLAQEHVDVLFADVVMPGINGIELAKQAKALRPDLRILLVTGYFSRAAEARSVATLLYKPLRADQIEAEIRNLLN
jgi:DNA-binding NtrC family response regulator